MGRMGSLRMLHTLRQTLAREPDARGRGVHRLGTTSRSCR